jgi:predicted restriction endonuclease
MRRKYGSRVAVSYPDIAIELSPLEAHPVKPTGRAKPGRRSAGTTPIVRSLEVADFVKQVHNHTCQMCGVRPVVKDQGYSQGRTYRPSAVFKPARIFRKTSSVSALTYNGTEVGKLRLDDRHVVDDRYLKFHREIHS